MKAVRIKFHQDTATIQEPIDEWEKSDNFSITSVLYNDWYGSSAM